MHSRKYLKTLLAAGLATAFGAATAGAATEKFKIDPLHVWLNFGIDDGGYGKALGHFNNIKGDIVFDKDDVSKSSVSAELDLAGIDTNDQGRNEEVQGFLGMARQPQITFVSTKVEKVDDNHGKVTGDLTTGGHTASVTMDVTFNKEARSVVGFSASGSLNINDLKIYGPQALDLGSVVDY